MTAASVPGAGAPTWVARLSLSEFRCYPRLDLDLARAPVVLCGPNGAGKTNLLEAVSLLAPGRGLRGARLADIARRDAPARAWAVSARVETPQGPVRLGTGLDPGGEGERRVVRVDGETVRGQTALARTLAVLWLTPAMDRLFTDAPAARRRFLDRMVAGLEPGHAASLGAYERGLRERARLLAGRAEAGWIAAVEETMAGHAIAVAAARRDTVARLAAALGQVAPPFPRATVALAGDVEGWLGEMPALDAEQRLCARLHARRGADAEAGRAGCGPHRSDLVVCDAAGVPAAHCSTGEQKALLISLVLANARLQAARRGAAPVILLDEVAAHLDQARRGALFAALTGLGVQAWLSGTDAALFAPLAGHAQVLDVARGRVSARR